MTKKKILWIVYNFTQAGGQRYVYEISKALDKSRYEIDFLKVAPMNHEKDWEGEFYYERTLELGCRIYQLSEILPDLASQQNNSLPYRALGYISRKLNVNLLPSANDYSNDQTARFADLVTFLSGYDHINFSGTSVYHTLFVANGLFYPNAIVHILTARFQDPRMYEGFDKQARYNFVSGMREDSIKQELSEFTNYRFTYFRICFETRPFEIEKKPASHKYSISVFTRLSTMKPLDPYFYALKLLIEEGIDVELNIYGAGDPVALGLRRQLDYLYISKNVNFRGHVEDIPSAIIDETPDLLWFQSSNSQPAGYAALEISMSGLPQVFWDFMYLGHPHSAKEIFPSFTSLTAFVNYTRELLESGELRRNLGEKQREYVLQHYSIRDNIHILEELFDR